MSEAPRTPPTLLTLPEAAANAGVSVFVLQRILSQRPDLAGLILRAGTRRMLLSESLPALRDAIREDSRR